MAPSTDLIKGWFPHIKSPVICSAPMRLVAGVDLVCAVTKAGGLGFFGAGYDISSLDDDLTIIRQNLSLASDSPLPIGVGFISHSIDFKPAFEIVQKHKVQAVWLSFPTSESDEETLKTEKEWIDNVKKLETQCKVFVQVGSVKGAQRAVEGGASAIVTQASDAGGHGWVSGAGMTTLVPEVCDYLEEKGLRDEIPVLATGGIMDGRGLVAALGLGANGIVMGTRFVACTESMAHDNMKAKLVATRDGGQSTARSRFFDQLRGTEHIWPEGYNGRGICNDSWHEVHGHASLDADQTQTRRSHDEVKQLFKKAEQEHDYDRGIVFAGTGVGLIDEVLSAGTIIEQTHAIARDRMKILHKMLV